MRRSRTVPIHLARFALLLFVPPAGAVLMGHATWLATRGQEYCLDSLNLNTPGLVCVPGIDLWVRVFLFAAFHAALMTLIAIRMAAGRSPVPAPLRVSPMLWGAVLLVLFNGAWIGVYRSGDAGSEPLLRSLTECASPVAFSTLLSLVLATITPRRPTKHCS
jgi:hypothetical protein